MNRTTLGIVGAAVAGAIVGGVIAWSIARPDETAYAIVLRATDHDIDNKHWAAVENALTKSASANPDASPHQQLYKIQEFNLKKPVRDEEGTLPETQFLVSQKDIIDSLPDDFTGHAYQIGWGGKPSFKQIPKADKLMPHAHGLPNMMESRELVKRVDDALNQ